MGYFILAFIIVGLIGIVSSVIRGSYLISKDKKLTENTVRRGYEYGIYYELQSGVEAFCFVHKDLIKANKSLSHLRKEGWFSQTEDWEGQVYCFTVESFEKAIGEQINRKKFKIVNRYFNHSENKNSPRLNFKQGFAPSMTK